MTDPAPALRGVVPLTIDLGSVDGHHLVLLSLEVWEGWADLRFARVAAEPTTRPLARRVPPDTAWRVTVDGRPLEVVDAVGRGDRAFSNGEVRLRPAPPSGARLDIEVVLRPGSEPLRTTVTLPGSRG